MRGSVPLGTTPTGIEWAMKAMHPAGEGSPAGVPDGFPRPTTKWMITCTSQVSAPAGPAAPSWDFDMVAFNHPLILAYVHSVYGSADTQYNVFNPAIYPNPPSSVALYKAGLTEFIGMVERYRPLYSSVTCTPVVSALTNQGSVTIAQYPQVYRDMAFDYEIHAESPKKDSVKEKSKKREDEDGAASSAVAPISRTAPNVRVEFPRKISNNPGYMEFARREYGSGPPPNADYTRYRSLLECYSEHYSDLTALTILPNTYVGQFKDGAYSVLKFTGDFNHWRNTRELKQHLGNSGALAMELDPTVLDLAPTAVSTKSYPYPDIIQSCVAESGWPVLPRCEQNVMQCSFRGLDPTAAVKITFRIAFECEVLPQSPIAPFVSSPAEPDAAALYAYSLITRRMKDGYPEAYNSWEKLVDVIKLASKAAGVVIPGAGLIGDAADWLYKTFSSGKKSSATPEEKAEAVRTKTKRALAISRPAAAQRGLSKADVAKILAVAGKGKGRKKGGKRGK